MYSKIRLVVGREALGSYKKLLGTNVVRSIVGEGVANVILDEHHPRALVERLKEERGIVSALVDRYIPGALDPEVAQLTHNLSETHFLYMDVITRKWLKGMIKAEKAKSEKTEAEKEAQEQSSHIEDELDGFQREASDMISATDDAMKRFGICGRKLLIPDQFIFQSPHQKKDLGIDAA